MLNTRGRCVLRQDALRVAHERGDSRPSAAGSGPAPASPDPAAERLSRSTQLAAVLVAVAGERQPVAASPGVRHGDPGPRGDVAPGGGAERPKVGPDEVLQALVLRWRRSDRPSPRRGRVGRPAAAPTCPTAGPGRGRPRGRGSRRTRLRARRAPSPSAARPRAPRASGSADSISEASSPFRPGVRSAHSRRAWRTPIA